MADISKIKINNVEYDIKDAQARAGFAYASVVRVNTDEDFQTRLVFYKDSAKTQELGSVNLSYMNLEGLLANQVFVGEGVTTPLIGIDNLEDNIADSTAITVKKVNGKPVFVFSSTADGTSGADKTEVTLPVGASGEVALKSQVDAVANDLAALVGTGDVSAAIDSFNEVVTFLNGIDKTDPTLANQLLGINDRIDAIEAVSGTVDNTLSSTSTNPVQNKVINEALNSKANKSELTVTAVTGDTTKKTIQLKSGTSQTVVVEHQDISGKANKSEMSVSKGTGTNAGKTTITLTSETGKSATLLDSTHPAASITDANKTAWNNKQSAINDLDTIRSGAGKGATSVQTISVNEGTPMQPTNGNVDITIPSAAWADVKPSGGVPKDDLASGVKTSLGKADSAIQGVKVNGTELTPDPNKKVDVTVPTKLSDLSEDTTHMLVTQSEKSTWNNKQNALTFDNTPTKSSANPVKSGGVYSALADLYDGYDSTTETLSFTFPTE